jgi:hypothetical protein
MNAQQRRVALRRLPKQGSKVGYHGKNGLIEVRVGGLVIRDNGKPSLQRVKITNPATRGRATPLLKQLVY